MHYRIQMRPNPVSNLLFLHEPCLVVQPDPGREVRGATGYDRALGDAHTFGRSENIDSPSAPIDGI